MPLMDVFGRLSAAAGVHRGARGGTIAGLKSVVETRTSRLAVGLSIVTMAGEASVFDR
jgi:hypothetical protein